MEPKYKYSAGLEKGAGLVGLERARGQARLLLVEGVLDALYLAAQGLPAVAVGGTDFSSRQLQAVEHNRTPVSYTHLDVYKRQDRARSSRPNNESLRSVPSA